MNCISEFPGVSVGSMPRAFHKLPRGPLRMLTYRMLVHFTQQALILTLSLFLDATIMTKASRSISRIHTRVRLRGDLESQMEPLVRVLSGEMDDEEERLGLAGAKITISSANHV